MAILKNQLGIPGLFDSETASLLRSNTKGDTFPKDWTAFILQRYSWVFLESDSRLLISHANPAFVQILKSKTFYNIFSYSSYHGSQRTRIWWHNYNNCKIVRLVRNLSPVYT